jgi:hypothetical protein
MDQAEQAMRTGLIQELETELIREQRWRTMARGGRNVCRRDQ